MLKYTKKPSKNLLDVLSRRSRKLSVTVKRLRLKMPRTSQRTTSMQFIVGLLVFLGFCASSLIPFHRAQHNDSNMNEMEPAESFALTLRGYQKQALWYVLITTTFLHTNLIQMIVGCTLWKLVPWMLATLRRCILYGRSRDIFHNVYNSWLTGCRYAFPQEPVMDGDAIDLTADEKLFYFNPYSGELSLTFPRAERNCKGGILA